MKLKAQHLLPIAALLLVQFFIRAHNLTVQDAYIDEGFHITRAAVVWDFAQNPGRFGHGKVLLYFWLGLFETHPHTSLFSSRLGMALFSLITSSAIYILGRTLRDHKTGLLALGLYAVLPFAFFYERMAMADPFSGGLAALVAWRSLVFARRPSTREGIILGVLIGLTTMAKLTMGLIAFLPALAALLYFGWQPHGIAMQVRSWFNTYMPPLVLAALIVVLMWLPLALPAYLAQDSDEPFVLVSSFNIRGEGARDPGTPPQYLEKLMPLIFDFTRREAWIVMGAGLLLWLLVARVRQEYKHLGFLTLWFLVMSVLSVFAARLITSRYFMPIAAPLVLAFAFVIMGLWNRRGVWRGLSAILMAATGVWIAFFARPFAYTNATNPPELPLEATNYTEYLSGFITADSAVREAAHTLSTLDPAPDEVYGTWTICEMMYFYADYDLTCLEMRTSSSALKAHLEAELDPGETGYIVVSGYRPFFTNIDGLKTEQVVSLDRPTIHWTIDIWRLEWETN